MMPSVQPKAVTRLRRGPPRNPAAIDSSAPVPGVATTTKAVTRKVGLTRPIVPGDVRKSRGS
jgi:hypothetical protein